MDGKYLHLYVVFYLYWSLTFVWVQTLFAGTRLFSSSQHISIFVVPFTIGVHHTIRDSIRESTSRANYSLTLKQSLILPFVLKGDCRAVDEGALDIFEYRSSSYNRFHGTRYTIQSGHRMDLVSVTADVTIVIHTALCVCSWFTFNGSMLCKRIVTMRRL
jgi:hypothetical protein